MNVQNKRAPPPPLPRKYFEHYYTTITPGEVCTVGSNNRVVEDLPLKNMEMKVNQPEKPSSFCFRTRVKRLPSIKSVLGYDYFHTLGKPILE